MPVNRRESKSIRVHRRDNSNSTTTDDSNIDDCTTLMTSNDHFTEEQLRLRAMIPAITPAHGPESTATAIRAALVTEINRPNSHTRRKSDGHVNRPPNAFIVFRRAQVQNMPPNVTQHQQRISNLTALFWRVLTHSEQKTWFSLADDIKKLHTIMYPDYNFNPRNPDGSKKPTILPHAGVTEDRRMMAEHEAEVLIGIHTTMIDHPAAPPASCSGKLPRPKAPRKGQGTRAKERREREAAERVAAAAAATAQVASEDLVYSTGHLSSVAFDNAAYYTTIEEEPASTPSSDTPIAWRPDFSLDGGNASSSRSSPSNSWSEFGSADSSGGVDPLDASYCYDANPMTAPAVVEEYNYGQYVAPYTSYVTPQAHHDVSTAQHAFSDLALAPPSISQKRDNAYNQLPKYATTSTHGPVTTYTSYYEPQVPVNATSAPVVGHAEFVPGQTEAQYVFHDIDPTATYLNHVDPYAAATSYVW